ncbi:unnamed protein product [Alternaria alternata]
MRFLRYGDTGDLGFITFDDEPIPAYAILSHTWGADTEEVTFEDLINRTGKDKPGYEKIRFCEEQASRDGLHYFWVDTCCIDKENQAERSLAIASMFRWYSNANQCYVYPSGLSITERTVSGQFTSEPDFQESQWFAQKLLPAPHSVENKRSREGFRLEVEVLKKLSHRHPVPLIGSYAHRRSVEMLLNPVAVCDLGTFFENAEALFSQKVQEVERLKAKFKPEHLLEYLMPVMSAKEGSIGLLNAGRFSEDIFVLGLITGLQMMETEFDVLPEAIRGRGRRWPYEGSIKNGRYSRELRQEEKQGLEYHRTIAFERNATKCDEIGANCGLGCQHIRIHGLCTHQNDRADSAKQPKLMAQYYRNAVYTPDRFSFSVEEACVANNLPCLVMHDTCDYRVSKSFMTFKKLGSDGEGIAVQDPSPINMKGSPAINVQDPSNIHQRPTYSAPQYAYQAPELPLPHRFHIAPTWGGIGDIQFVPGAEEQCVIESNVTCSTALSDKTSVFSKPSENDPAAGTEISNRYNASTSTSQSWQEVPLLRMGQILSANAHGSWEPELQNNKPVTPGFEDSHLSADRREDSGYGDRELPTLGKDAAHSEEAILANYETSALRDFVDDPGHQYWTWCKEHQNWWHKDEKTEAMIWAPLDFD